MAKDTEVLTKAKIEALKEGVTHYFPFESGDASTYVYVNDTWSDIGGEFGKWRGRDDFFTTLSEATGIQSLREIKKASSILDTMESKAPTMVEAPKGVDSNSLAPDKLAQFEEEAKARDVKIKESIQKAKADVQAEITRQEKLRDEINNRKIYQKTERAKIIEEQNRNKALETLQTKALNNPKGVERQIETKIYNRLKSTLPKGTPDHEIQAMATRGAVGVVKNLRGESLAEQVVVANQISKNLEVLHRAGIENAAALEIQNTAQKVAAEGALRYNLEREIVANSLSERFAIDVYGPKNLDDIKTVISPAAFEGARPFELSQISNNYSNSLEGQNIFLDSIKDFGGSAIKDKLTSHLMSWAESSLPEGFIESVTENRAIQAALDIYGVSVGESTIAAWEGTTLFGRLAIGSGYGNVVGWLGEFTGIDFGVSAASTAMTSEVVGETIATGAIYTTETIAGAGSIGVATIAGVETGVASTAIGGVAGGVATGAVETVVASTAAGTVVPGVGNLVGLGIGLVTAIVGPKAIGWVKDNLHKIKPVLVGGMVAVFGAVVGGPIIGYLGASILSFGAGYFGYNAFSSGLSGVGSAASGVAKGLLNVGWAIGATALVGIGGPLITILLVFPVVIALILFIINSGAYVVPPSISSLSSENQFIDVTKTATPPGPFENSDLPLKITYTIKVSAKKETLTNITIKDDCQVVTKSGTQKCTSQSVVVPDNSIAVGSPFTFSYDANYNSSYKDAFVINTVSVTANVVSQSNSQKIDASTSIKIGNPPETCPNGWPTSHGDVRQGAYTTSSHSSLEAIDVGVSHTGVTTTHSGVVVHAQSDSCYGNNVQIQSSCGGKGFVSRYAHLEAIGVKVGQAVIFGQQIGLSGNTTGGKASCSSGPHLHYDFHYWPNWTSTKYPGSAPYMMNPYLPANVKRGCVENCFVTW